jgi:hypothetical protein|tara:strand:+ start:95 stop:607 length:513 start_codon:yes stop_codon:yes gene_type:complete
MRKALSVLLLALTLQIQAQNPYCDSLAYNLGQGQVFNISFDTSAILTSIPVDSIEVLWSVCNSITCYNEEGMTAYFQLIQQTDTIKVCYDSYIYSSGQYDFCTDCDSLIYDQNTFSWVMFSIQGNSTNINELMMDKFGDNKMYDIHGRKLLSPQFGQMYIQNKKKYIKIR